MYRATYPPIRVITAAQQAWNPRITSRRSSGSSVAARTVEPTRSQKRTVSWRLSGSDCNRAGPVAGAPAAGVAPDSAAIALRILFRWPSATPNFSRSASVTSGKTSRSMAFSAKAVAYWASPIPSSQVSIWSLSLTVACSPRPPRVLLHFPLSSLHIALRPRRERPRHPAAEQREELPASHAELPPRTSVDRFTATLSLPQIAGYVLEVDLNCSESRRGRCLCGPPTIAYTGRTSPAIAGF